MHLAGVGFDVSQVLQYVSVVVVDDNVVHCGAHPQCLVTLLMLQFLLPSLPTP